MSEAKSATASLSGGTRPMQIGSRWVIGSGEPIESINPADGSTNALVSTAGAGDLEDAIAIARTAFMSRGWRNMYPHQRADMLQRIAALLLERDEFLARTVVSENGKTLRECLSQVRQAAAIFRYYAGVVETAQSEITPPRGEYFSFTLREPVGVVAAITTWNSPVNVAAEKLAPALGAGNAVILKPSELTSLVSLEIGRICIDAGVPPGLVSVLPGAASASARLVAHPGIDMVSFTGGTAAGRAIARVAGDKLIPVLLELGGKSPHIVFGDANIDRACIDVAAGVFGSMGQTCIAGSRLFVQRAIRDEVVDRIVAIAKSIRVGSPLAESSALGPMASFQHRNRVHGLVIDAVREGGVVLTGGAAPVGAEFERGAFYLPTIIDGLTNDAKTCQTEIFGPVLCVLPFDDEDDLLVQANATVYGLACGIWTQDFERGFRIARGIDAGTVWFNTYRQNSVATPFGGFKQSGLGRERGLQGLTQYERVKSVFVGLRASP